METTIKFKKCWVRSNSNEHWIPRWYIEGTDNVCVRFVGHDVEDIPVKSAVDTTCWNQLVYSNPIESEKQLVGKICGISNTSLAKAKILADTYNDLHKIKSYDEDIDTYTTVSGGCVKYAYPIKEDIK